MNSYSQNKLPLPPKRILITGATGFIGSHLARRLVASQHRVTALIRPSSNLWRIKDIAPDIKIIPADLNHLDTRSFKKQLGPIDIVYHLAAYGISQKENDFDLLMQTNLFATQKILDLCNNLKIKKVILCGSCFEYSGGKKIKESTLPDPVSEYGFSKFSASILANSFFLREKLPIVNLRLFTPFGPFEDAERLIPSTILRALNNQPILLTTGHQTRDFIFIDDVVNAFLLAAQSSQAIGETCHIASANATSIRDIVKMILRLAQSRSQAQFGKLPLRPQEIKTLSGDFSKAKRLLKWQPHVSLEDGLRKTIDWFRMNKHLYSHASR